MNRDFVAAMRKGSIAFAAAAAFCVPLLGGCGVKGPLKPPTPPSTAASPPSEPKPDASRSSGASPAAAPQPTERAP